MSPFYSIFMKSFDLITFVLLWGYWTTSIWYHIFSWSSTLVVERPLSPICVCTWITDWFFSLNIAGSLSPIPQQSLVVEVNRRISAHDPLGFSSLYELMKQSKDTLYVGPQVGKVASKLFLTRDIPGRKCFLNCHYSCISMLPVFVYLYQSHDRCFSGQHQQGGNYYSETLNSTL